MSAPWALAAITRSATFHSGEAMDQIRWAQGRGMKIYGEACPQYLMLTERDLDGLYMEGAKYVCSPPPRDAASQLARPPNWRVPGIFIGSLSFSI